jgi:acyl transferase domain-containing protein/acyl carrier protein
MSSTPEKLDQLSPLQRAVYALKETRSQLDAIQSLQNEPIAIIGMGCRFPGGANDPESFWQLLSHGGDAIREVPPERWDVDKYYDPNPDTSGTMYTRQGGFLNVGVDAFDAEFFGLAPREVVNMDPQQRLLLEVSWEALEQAGYASDKLNGSKTGVFVGITTNDYAQQTIFAETNNIDIYTATGSGFNVAAGRLSYILGLQGPSMAIDTACSSSLVAVHLACQSLRTGECHMALAGGVNLILSPHITIAMSKLRALSADGRCKTFDAAADGYGRGEGCGITILKRLTSAITDGDNILAVIRGSAVNQDGRSSGLTVPNGLAQQEVLRTALKNAKVEPSQINYVEAHGTGTPLGDPIELKALGTVLEQGRSDKNSLMVGSVKTNIGHLEAAAGIASLIKVVLAMQHNIIPPHLHLKKINPHIAAQNLPVIVPTEQVSWPTTDGGEGNPDSRHLAGVSSFGFSGTNAHVVLEAAPVRKSALINVDRPLHILTLSAKSDAALTSLAKRFQHHVKAYPSASLGDICFTANTGRSHFNRRLSIVAESLEQVCQQLADVVAGKKFSTEFNQLLLSTSKPKLAFIFTGQGLHYIDMGRQLYDTQLTFKKALDRCDELLRPYLGESLLSILYPQSKNFSLLNETAYAQPALFALEYAIAELWQSWGIEPTAVMGYGIGEYVAACVANVFSLEDGLKLITKRAKLMQSLPADSNVSHCIEAIPETFQSIAEEIEYFTPQLPLISNLTGKPVTGQEIASAQYWQHHTQEPLKFSEGIQTLYKQGYQLFVEISPHPTLTYMKQSYLPEGIGFWLPSLTREQGDWQQLLQSLGTLYEQGVDVDWDAFDRDYQRHRLPLPTYPFECQRYWTDVIKDRQPKVESISRQLSHPLLDQRLDSPLKQIQFESQFSLDSLPLVRDHRIYDIPFLNFVIYLEMALAGAMEAFGKKALTIEDVLISQPLILFKDKMQPVQLILQPEHSGQATFQIFSLTNNEVETKAAWILHVTGKLCFENVEFASSAKMSISVEEIQARYEKKFTSAEFYQMIGDRGASLGPTCQWLKQIWLGYGEALGSIKSPATEDEFYAAYQLPLGVVDACFQILGVCLLDIADGYILAGVEKFHFHNRSEQPLWTNAVLKLNEHRETISGDIRVFDETGLLVIEVLNAQLRRVNQEALHVAKETKYTSVSSGVAQPIAHTSLLREQLLAMKLRERQLILENYLLTKLAKALQLPVSKLQSQQSLASLIDSLIVIELKNQIETELQITVPGTKFFEEISIAQLATFVSEQFQ